MNVDHDGISPEWIRDCMHWRGRVLTGKFGHWCDDWDMLPVDETCDEYSTCHCFPDLKFSHVEPSE